MHVHSYFRSRLPPVTIMSSQPRFMSLPTLPPTLPHKLSSSPHPDETTTLLPKDRSSSETKPLFPPIRRVLFVSFLTSMTFAFTQTSLMYAFHDMTCDEFYQSHEWDGFGDRCASRAIEAKTVRDIAIMASITTGSCTSLSSSSEPIQLIHDLPSHPQPIRNRHVHQALRR